MRGLIKVRGIPESVSDNPREEARITVDGSRFRVDDLANSAR